MKTASLVSSKSLRNLCSDLRKDSRVFFLSVTSLNKAIICHFSPTFSESRESSMYVSMPSFPVMEKSSTLSPSTASSGIDDKGITSAMANCSFCSSE